MFYNLPYRLFMENYAAIREDIRSQGEYAYLSFRQGMCRRDGFHNYPVHPIERLFDMARASKAKKNANFSNMAFINVKFNAAEKKRFEAWKSVEDGTPFKALHSTLQDDNKISVSWDIEKKCYIGAMTGRTDSLNPDKCIIIRASDYEKAVLALAFVHTVMYNGQVWEAEEDDDIL